MLIALTTACILLAVAYSAVGIFSIHQLVKMYQQDELSCASYECWFPRTIQRQVQFLVVFLTLTRSAFFLVAIFAWDATEGDVDNYRGAFYSLDELSTIAFFSLACVLALFWAEVYYIAIDQVQEYRYLIRPMMYAINAGAYVAVIGCAYAAVHASSDTSSYIYWNFSLLISILFILAALVFTFFAYKAATEIAVIPVHMATRQERTDELSRIFSIFILALVARAACLLLMSNDDLSTNSSLGIVLLAAYFVMLELIPTIFAIVFYRTLSIYDDSGAGVYGHKIRFDDVMASLEEVQPLSGRFGEEDNVSHSYSKSKTFLDTSDSNYNINNSATFQSNTTIDYASASSSLEEQLAVETLLKRLNGSKNVTTALKSTNDEKSTSLI